MSTLGRDSNGVRTDSSAFSRFIVDRPRWAATRTCLPADRRIKPLDNQYPTGSQSAGLSKHPLPHIGLASIHHGTFRRDSWLSHLIHIRIIDYRGFSSLFSQPSGANQTPGMLRIPRIFRYCLLPPDHSGLGRWYLGGWRSYCLECSRWDLRSLCYSLGRRSTTDISRRISHPSIPVTSENGDNVGGVGLPDSGVKA